MEHHFNVSIAQKYNINIATFLHNIAFWTQHNIANKRNFHDGLYWTYNSYEAFTVLFPYWTYEQIRLIISKCIQEGLLIKGNYNKLKYDKTKWYALTKKGLDLCGLVICENTQVNKTLICENSQMDLPKTTDGSVQKARPIPDSKPDSKPTTTAAVVNDHFFTNELKQEFLNLRKQSQDSKDERTDEEFLEQCKFHLENSTNKNFTLQQAIKGLETIIKQGFTPPGEYVQTIDKQKQKEENDKRIKNIEDKSLNDFYTENKIPISENNKAKSSQLLALLKTL